MDKSIYKTYFSDYMNIISKGLGFGVGKRHTGRMLLRELEGNQVLVLGLKEA